MFVSNPWSACSSKLQGLRCKGFAQSWCTEDVTEIRPCCLRQTLMNGFEDRSPGKYCRSGAMHLRSLSLSVSCSCWAAGAGDGARSLKLCRYPQFATAAQLIFRRDCIGCKMAAWLSHLRSLCSSESSNVYNQLGLPAGTLRKGQTAGITRETGMVPNVGCMRSRQSCPFSQASLNHKMPDLAGA